MPQMPGLTTADLTTPVAFPDDPGPPVWREERRMPVFVLFAVPLAFLLAAVVVVEPRSGKVALVAAAFLLGWLLIRARRSSLIETFAVSDRFVTIEQRAGGRVALPVETVTGVTVRGDRVRLESTGGVVTLGFVRHRKGLVRALEHVAPAVKVEWDARAFCPT
jgi:hypothetical protein